MIKKIGLFSLSLLLLFSSSVSATENIDSPKTLKEGSEVNINSFLESIDQKKIEASNQLENEEERIMENIRRYSADRKKMERDRSEGKTYNLESLNQESSIGVMSYNHDINWASWGYADMIFGAGTDGSSSSIPTGYYRHAATYDYAYGNFISAMPNKGVRRESKDFWETRYREVVGYWVPSASSQHKRDVINYIKQQMGEPYLWYTSKTDYSKWYCTKLPYVAFRGNAGIDIDADGGYWVFPDDIVSDSQTYLFMSER